MRGLRPPVDRQGRTQRTLNPAGPGIQFHPALDTLLEEIAKSMHTLINYDAFVILRVDQPAGQLRSLFNSLRYESACSLTACPWTRASPAPPPFGQPVPVARHPQRSALTSSRTRAFAAKSRPADCEGPRSSA